MSYRSGEEGADFLDTIAGKARFRVAQAKEAAPIEQVRKQALALAEKKQAGNGFEQALRQPGLSFICEVKKASPSKGIIAADFPYLEIAKEYGAAGASAISVLTEPDYFLGADRYLREIAEAVTVPVLRKDFIIDPYQLYETKLLGAQAVLLICALLDRETLNSYIKIAAELGLSALVEIHDEKEAGYAVQAGARIIGINNRDLKTFKVDIGLCGRLREWIPAGIITVAESGIQSPEDIRTLNNLAFDAALIGESLMRAQDKKRFLAELKTAGGGEHGEN